MPVVNKFVTRDQEMQKLESLLIDGPIASRGRRNVVIVHGMGGIGKTQLAVEFARKHHQHFSAVFWLDGSSETSLKQSFVDMMKRIPRSELTTDDAARLGDAAVEADVTVRECQHWLSIPSNSHWLLVVDNVDRDYRDKGDSQAYNVKDYFPDADHGSMLITSRLSDLQRLGSGIKLGVVGAGQARAILESNTGRSVEGKYKTYLSKNTTATNIVEPDADLVLDLLQGLPLALTQAGTYMRETNMSALGYAEHYNQTWTRLMESQDKFPLEEYDRSVMTTWSISFNQVKKRSEEAAYLLRLWGFLDSGEVWYELFAPKRRLLDDAGYPRWLQTITEDAPAFAATMGLLSRFSLAEGREGTDSHSMHSVLHKWCSDITKDTEQQEFGCLAASLVASNVPLDSEADYWTKRKRIMAHGLCVYQWIEKLGEAYGKRSIAPSVPPSHLHGLGYLFDLDHMHQAEQMYLRALHGYEKAHGPDSELIFCAVNNLGDLYSRLGRLEEAELMLQRALHGLEKILGPEDERTLMTVNNLGLLYQVLGRLDDAEQMLQRALDGKEKIFGSEDMNTLNTVNNLSLLYLDLGRLEEAEQMLQRVLDGREKTLGSDDIRTLMTVSTLGQFYIDVGRPDDAEQMLERAQAGYIQLLGTAGLRLNGDALMYIWAFAGLRWKQGRVDEAKYGYSQALRGYEKIYGPDHKECQRLRDWIATLAQQSEEHGSSSIVEEVEDEPGDSNGGTSQKRSAIAIEEAVQEHSLEERDIAESGRGPQENQGILSHNCPERVIATSGQKPVSFRRRLVAKLTRK
jgi:tetratricopeptide (TPR) repeat protein